MEFPARFLITVVCLRYQLSVHDPSFTACLKWLHDCSPKPSQIVELSEQNEFNFRIMVIPFPFVCKVLKSAVSFEGCGFSLYRSLCIGSRSLCLK